jgi:hypothetical protein
VPNRVYKAESGTEDHEVLCLIKSGLTMLIVESVLTDFNRVKVDL